MTHVQRPLRSAMVFALALACRRAAPAAETAPQSGHPLAGLAGQQVIVTPVQFFGSDSMGWSAKMGVAREYLANLDDEIGFALRERANIATWVTAKELAASARRNAPYTPDPYVLATDPMRGGRRLDAQLYEPFGSQIRKLVALHEGRFAMVPVELRFDRTAPGAGRAVLRVVIIDSRLSQVRWAGEVASDVYPAFSPAIAASVANHLADLIAAR